MKFIISLLLLLSCVSDMMAQDASSLYQLSFPAVDSGRTIHMVDYQGKKVIVAVCSATNMDTNLVHGLDTLLQGNGDKLEVIIVPVSDVDATGQGDSLVEQWRALGSNCILAAAGMGKKASGSSQHPLLRWVTNRSQNGHFEYDVKQSGDLFVISETGRLFAVIQQGNIINGTVLQDILTLKVPNN